MSDEGMKSQSDDVLHVQLTAIFPPDADSADPVAAYLIALNGRDIASVRLATGERDAVEQIVERVDLSLANQQANQQAMETVTETAEVEKPVRHIDGGGTAHWFAIAASDEAESDESARSPYELRYFRELEMDDGTTRGDSYAVMPLPDDDPGSAWPLPGLEMYLAKGDVYMAQQFAYDVADAYGQPFPEPLELPALDPRPEYYFGYGIGPNDLPSLEAVKTWVVGAERHFDTFTVGEYGTFDEAAIDERELETLLDEEGVEAAMNLAERMAADAGYLDPQRDDPRIFFDDSGPVDPFTTQRAQDLALEKAAPRYSVGAISANGESFLDVMKTWGDDAYERLVVPQPDWERAAANAELASALIERDQLRLAMRLVEDEGVAAGVIDPERDDPRIFAQGPLDPFVTLRETEINADLARYGVTWREMQSWELELSDEVPTPTADAPSHSPHWRLETLPVNGPDGAPLGYSLHMVVYDGVEHDPEMVGTPAIPEDEPFRMLEMAHFETTEAADKFGVAFNGYLMPGLLEGPELAEEVARLEGHPVEWKTLDGQELDDYRDLKLTLTRDPADWQPYNRNAERDARIEAEGLYTDPIQQFTRLDEEEPKVEPVSPDFDL